LKAKDSMSNPHDVVAYPGHAFPDTHPDRLAAMALLHGLNPTPVERCRVLEVGCNSGANLIPMAYAMPGSEFVGFDLAGLPIERGQQRIRELGLRNIRLFQANLLDIGPDRNPELGQFDYIIAHGVYSWVPPDVSGRLLDLCSRLLAPNGIAFISYNALPGCHLRSLIRDAMLLCGEGIENPEERVASGIAFLRFLHEARGEDDAYGKLLAEQFEKLTERDPYVTFHDELCEAYHAVSFLDFVNRARAHGLDYLSESTLPPPTDPSYRAEIRAALEEAAPGDPLRQEQMLDYIRGRFYRETLLCRTGLAVARDFSTVHLRRLHFASQATSSPSATPGAVDFTLPSGTRMELMRPGAIAFLKALEDAWPNALSYEEILERAVGSALALDEDGRLLLIRMVVAKMVELRSWSAPAARQVSTRPRASACSRLDALGQDARAREEAVSLLHTTIRLDDPRLSCLLGLLDGTRDQVALLDAMQAAFPASPRQELEEGIEPGLRFLCRIGMLEA
jgi:SAM-dependent methyltransferase